MSLFLRHYFVEDFYQQSQQHSRGVVVPAKWSFNSIGVVNPVRWSGKSIGVNNPDQYSIISL